MRQDPTVLSGRSGRSGRALSRQSFDLNRAVVKHRRAAHVGQQLRGQLVHVCAFGTELAPPNVLQGIHRASDQVEAVKQIRQSKCQRCGLR